MDADDLGNINRILNKVREENTHLQHLKTRYVEHAKELQDIVVVLKSLIERVDKLAEEIDPVQAALKTPHKSVKRVEQVEELYEKMQSGVQVTSTLIKNTYNANTSNTAYIIKCLREKPNVKEARDGIKVRLFL
jgi:uncharacterized coiled-coil DUF342 family protein